MELHLTLVEIIDPETVPARPRLAGGAGILGNSNRRKFSKSEPIDSTRDQYRGRGTREAAKEKTDEAEENQCAG
jgi:hypothetical protein